MRVFLIGIAWRKTRNLALPWIEDPARLPVMPMHWRSPFFPRLEEEEEEEVHSYDQLWKRRYTRTTNKWLSRFLETREPSLPPLSCDNQRQQQRHLPFFIFYSARGKIGAAAAAAVVARMVGWLVRHTSLLPRCVSAQSLLPVIVGMNARSKLARDQCFREKIH